MKTIVCYGDSNTWGYMPKREHPEITANNRFPWGVRWTSLLQMKLGADYRVEEEGLNGRTTMFDDPLDVCRNGLESIDCCMLTKTPVDLVILMLGTNDCKSYYKADASQIAKGLCKIPIDFSLANSFSRFYNYFIHTIRLQQINRIPHFARQSHANIRYRTSYSVNLTNRG